MRTALVLSAGTPATPDVEERELDDIDDDEPEPERVEERVVAQPGTLGAMTERQLVDSVSTAVSSAMSDVAYRLFGKVQ